MKKTRLVYFGFFSILALTVLSYWIGVGGAYAELLRNAAYLLAPLFAVVGGLYALKAYGLKSTSSYPFMCMVLGLLLWFAGEALWVYYEFVIQVTPYPSIADYFYLSAYPAFIIGLIEQVKTSGVNLRKFDPVIVFLLGIIAALLSGLVVYFGIHMAYDPASTALENIVAIAYVLADCLIILSCLFVLILAWKYKGGNLMRLYLAYFFAFSMTMVADIGFAIYNDEYVSEAWWIKNTLDSLWILQYLYFGLALFLFALSLQAAQTRLQPPSKQRT